jgi:CBS domain-containing protein
MSKPEATQPSSKQALDSLMMLRDRARVQLHLLSLEARGRWQVLETKMGELQTALEHGGERLASSASTSLHELTHAVGELLHEVEGTLELKTPVRTLMKTAPEVCSPSDSLSRAAQIMWEADCGAVPVVSDGKLVGMITDRDVCMAAYTRGEPISGISVESTMSKEVCATSPDDSLMDVARLMGQKQVHRIPVTENGSLVGIVALADLARHVRGSAGNSLPACVTLAHTVAKISEHRPEAAERSAAE